MARVKIKIASYWIFRFYWQKHDIRIHTHARVKNIQFILLLSLFPPPRVKKKGPLEGPSEAWGTGDREWFRYTRGLNGTDAREFSEHCTREEQ